MEVHHYCLKVGMMTLHVCPACRDCCMLHLCRSCRTLSGRGVTCISNPNGAFHAPQQAAFQDQRLTDKASVMLEMRISHIKRKCSCRRTKHGQTRLCTRKIASQMTGRLLVR